ncbi:homoserine O-succinyltransferase MetA [Ectothiorhodospira mobilis]|uniref:homoserine O-succinyltransferase MetA n=1 Tax=Ectothiorhodospira mobilis TaxID=195064 RepID=UPI0019057810|nr:homoserine O-succinyltransferase [Ectothiorhodospira mobilis]MBK1691952.1 homoserine O-succinyltransferase [Ectothiorhodospira mobilis]
MPLVAHTPLPTFQRLKQEGQTVLTGDYALRQDIRAMHIGLLNMMPDAALAATERQFFRLVGESNQIAQFYLHPFTLDALERGPKGREHIQRYYEPWEKIQEEGLDALIITGANVTQVDLSLEPFWEPLIEVIDWAYENVTSTLCSCLATHAVMQFRYGQARRPLGFKRWGVYPHRVVDRAHPLVAGVNTRFDVPHSRFNEISREQFEAAGLKVLAESEEAGVHLAVSEDQFRIVFFQGHPEYDIISLLKEYKREVRRYAEGGRPDYPPIVQNYFTLKGEAILEEYRELLNCALARGETPPEFPEGLLIEQLDNTWHDTAEAVINNWIGNVYQSTHIDRKRPFRDEVDPQDPLGRRQGD